MNETYRIEGTELVITTVEPERLVPETINEQRVDIIANEKIIASMNEAIESENIQFNTYKAEYEARIAGYEADKHKAEVIKVKYDKLPEITNIKL